ncbi:hypothetical protein [Pseudomonas sp. ME-P-057]|uniref:hypothetical protein n=1 Tax=Pseudomonas sp. ME-P-057 TaxID=3040321 RepID=UPI0025562459|nr:hypothetical protein [Pseudomonas sp. ME-P-057]
MNFSNSNPNLENGIKELCEQLLISLQIVTDAMERVELACAGVSSAVRNTTDTRDTNNVVRYNLMEGIVRRELKKLSASTSMMKSALAESVKLLIENTEMALEIVNNIRTAGWADRTKHDQNELFLKDILKSLNVIEKKLSLSFYNIC